MSEGLATAHFWCQMSTICPTIPAHTYKKKRYSSDKDTFKEKNERMIEQVIFPFFLMSIPK